MSNASNARPWKLAETNFAHVKDHPYEVAVLPFGATEPHNLHLPYGTDTLQGDIVGEHICAEAHRRGARVALLPTIPYGTETNQHRCSMSLNLQPSTLSLIIRDLVDSLAGHGIRKILLLNSHGGNDFKPVLRELHNQSDAKLFLCNWYRVLSDCDREIFDEPGDHAGEMETAFGLAFFPQLVALDKDGRITADDGAVRNTRFPAVNEGWVSITRPWHLLTTNTGSGNPHAATAEKGKRMMELLVDRLATFLVELADAEIDEQFPF